MILWLRGKQVACKDGVPAVGWEIAMRNLQKGQVCFEDVWKFRSVVLVHLCDEVLWLRKVPTGVR